MANRTIIPDRAVQRPYTPRRLAFVADHGVIIDEDQAWSYLGNGYIVFNQEGKPLRMGRMFRQFEVDERSTAPEPLRGFGDLPQDGSYESQRARVRRQAALWEEYDRHQGMRFFFDSHHCITHIFFTVDARHRRADTVQNAVLVADIEDGRIIPPSNTGLLRPMRRASTGREVVVNQPPPSRPQQGRDAAEPRTHGDGDQPSEDDSNQQRPNAGHPSRINYDQLLRQSERR